MRNTRYKIVVSLIYLAWIGAVVQAATVQTTPASSSKYNVALNWDNASEQVVFAPSSGGTWYPRMLILSTGQWLCAYDTNEGSSGTCVRISKSTDAGKTWSSLSQASFGSGNAANGELIELPDGYILCAYRIVHGDVKTLNVSCSTDGGATWQHLSTIISNTDGVWEPQIIRKKDGQLLVFYAQEANVDGTDQVIEMQRSDDNGQSWHSPQVISRHPGSRDGMPVATLLANGDILVVLEGHNVKRAGQFCTWSVRSTNGGRTWGPRRLVYAPADSGRIAVAPYIVSVPNGPIFVSFQTDEDDKSSLKLGVVSSIDNGKTWTVQPKPFQQNPTEPYAWNSLRMEDPNTLIAATAAGRNKIKIIKATVSRPQP
ncbi:MAG: sialidase family protein [Anaerohalosphaeraceae bacterium]